MLFNSPQFIFLFLPVVVLLYYALTTSRARLLPKLWLVAASLFFYAWWNPVYLPILVISVLVNFYYGRALSKKKLNRHYKKLFLATGVGLNLVLLGYYKYADFFISNVNLLAGSHLQPLNLVLPLAISFFTFQQIAYLVDSYKDNTHEYNLLNYSLFVTFFPQLIAGPIVHHREMMPQFEKSGSKQVNWNNVAIGIFIFSLGLFKKTIIADSFAIWANAGFNAPAELDFFSAWGASLSYTFQLYYDFSAYTDMAIGAALLFNIRLPINFNSPYKATSIRDFWRRWHITLSRWLRDYIYIPLGGNRKSEYRSYSNILVTFFLGGLWHGAGWTFVLWGALHGFAVVSQRGWNKLGLRLPTPVAWFVTFMFVNITWVFFRASTLTDARLILGQMFHWGEFKFPDMMVEVAPFVTSLESAFKGADPFLLSYSIPAFSLVFILGAFLSPNSIQISGFVPYSGRFRLHPGILLGLLTSLIFFLAILTFAGQAEPGEFLYFNF